MWCKLREIRSDKLERKLSPYWDDPYCIKAALQNGAYKLEGLGGKQISKTLNVTHLKTYYK